MRKRPAGCTVITAPGPAFTTYVGVVMRICFAVLFLIWAAWTNAVGQAKSPSISFESVNRDVGTIPQGEIIKQAFAFANKGSATLEIKDVAHS